ncbi:DUF4199 domain-containing protein [Limibacter armeniacum]|uniref:DUF4199 domain-containing protein n=1 Tax=Limibacter armeniacum TaxID=466084 RepID=UPI002FE618CF
MRQSSLTGGAIMFTGYLLFFIIMRALGLLEVVELRAINFIFLIAGVYTAISLEKKHLGWGFTYFQGLGAGIEATVLGVMPFAVFIFVYLSWIDPEFMVYIREHEPLGHYITPFMAAFVIVIEGCASGFISAYTIMQYVKAHTAHPHE